MPRPCVVDSVVLGNIGLDRFGPFDDVWTADERPRGTACLVNAKAPDLCPTGSAPVLGHIGADLA
jgi:hypothetical protein